MEIKYSCVTGTLIECQLKFQHDLYLKKSEYVLLKLCFVLCGKNVVQVLLIILFHTDCAFFSCTLVTGIPGGTGSAATGIKTYLL